MKKVLLAILAVVLTGFAYGQVREFETKQFDEPFDKVKIEVGGDFALQYQSLSHTADSTLIPLGKGLNLPTANFKINATLQRGIKVHLNTYLSSRHHVEAWVKGGYLIIDELPFIKSDGLDKVMDYVTVKAGVMELNYGDAHFFRSDNGYVIANPFVGNLVMDGFTTAPALELMFRHKSLMLMAGLNGGSLRPDLVRYSGFSGYTAYNMADELAFHFKAAFDKELNEDLRVRLALSGFMNKQHHFGSLYYGDRAGARYYLIMVPQTMSSDDVSISNNFTNGRWGPGFTNKNNAIMVNLFGSFKGFELFGTYEMAKGTTAFGGADFDFSQIAVEALYRFGKQDQFYGGARYNQVMNDGDMSVTRTQVALGWYMTPNIILKLEYVDQDYENFVIYGGNAGFDGIMFETAISF